MLIDTKCLHVQRQLLCCHYCQWNGLESTRDVGRDRPQRFSTAIVFPNDAIQLRDEMKFTVTAELACVEANH
jgi:hypothetical protein